MRFFNGQETETRTWTNVKAGISQGLILTPPLFLIYVNDLADELSNNAKLLVDDTSLFPMLHDVNSSAAGFNNDLAITLTPNTITSNTDTFHAVVFYETTS